MSRNSYPLSYVSRELNTILSEMIQEYGEDLSQKADKVTANIAEDFAKKLKEVTPRSDSDHDHMADTVRVTKKSEKSYGRTGKSYIVHYGKWQISHLLEFGWTAKNGKRITRSPFVRPLFDNNKSEYYQMYKEVLSK